MMSGANLALLPIIDQPKTSPPAALHELDAARYIGTNRTSFRELVMAGHIPYTMHLNGKRRIYLRKDLDTYLESLPKHIMSLRENSLRPALSKGDGTK
jgi:excisionase family DNA binding protein